MLEYVTNVFHMLKVTLLHVRN